MDERQEDQDKASPDKTEPANDASANAKAAAGGNLPLVPSPKLGGEENTDEAAAQADSAEARPTSTLPALFSEPASEPPDEQEAAAAEAQPRSFRFALLAATIACAAGIGALAGSLTASGFGHKDIAEAATPRAVNPHDVVGALKVQLAELSALKANLDSANRNANAEFAKITDRLNTLEHAQADPNTKLAHIADAVDRIEKRMGAAADITGSINAKPQATPAPDAAIAAPVLHDWAVQGVRNGRAMVESRYGALFLVGAGSVMPGLGHVHEVKRQNGEWIVVTDKGLITQHP
jgi:hypothetical protein